MLFRFCSLLLSVVVAVAEKITVSLSTSTKHLVLKMVDDNVDLVVNKTTEVIQEEASWFWTYLLRFVVSGFVILFFCTMAYQMIAKIVLETSKNMSGILCKAKPVHDDKKILATTSTESECCEYVSPSEPISPVEFDECDDLTSRMGSIHQGFDFYLEDGEEVGCSSI